MWLDVSEDLSIVAKAVVAVQSSGQMTCTIYTDARSFEVAMPKDVIMSLVEARTGKQDPMSNVEKLLTQIYQGQVTPRP